MVANGHLETPSATVELQIKACDNLFKGSHDQFNKSNIWNSFSTKKQRNSRHASKCISFAFCSMQFKHVDNTYCNFNEPIINPTDTLCQPIKQFVIHIKKQV